MNDLKQFPNQIQETLKRYVSKKTSKNQETLKSIDERVENGEFLGPTENWHVVESFVSKYHNMSTKEENLLDLEEQKQQQEIQLSLDSQYLGTLGGVSFQQLMNSAGSNMAYRTEQINQLQARNWEQKIQS